MPVHIKDVKFQAKIDGIKTHSLNLSLYQQPANSPDQNVLDLGLFSSIQADYYCHPPCKLDDLIDQVLASYNNLQPLKIDYAFQSMMACMNAIIDCNGTNTYKKPHQRKNKKRTLQQQPKALPVLEEIRQWL